VYWEYCVSIDMNYMLLLDVLDYCNILGVLFFYRHELHVAIGCSRLLLCTGSIVFLST